MNLMAIGFGLVVAGFGTFVYIPPGRDDKEHLDGYRQAIAQGRPPTSGERNIFRQTTIRRYGVALAAAGGVLMAIGVIFF